MDESPHDTNEFRTLTVEQATALVSQFADKPLLLNGLATLCEEVARALSKHKGDLHLDGLTTLSDKAAEALARHEGYRLSLNGLTALSAQLAEALLAYEESIELNGVEELSPDVAGVASRSKCDLGLNGLRTLSDQAAEQLAQRDSWCISTGTEVGEIFDLSSRLRLLGLESISPKAVELLSSNRLIILPSRLTGQP